LWSHREVALVLAARDIKVRYKQTFFGLTWAVGQPLLAMVLFSILLGRLADLPSDGVPYPLFVYAGLAVWFYVATAVTGAAETLVQNPDLVGKVYFPRALAPVSAVAAALLDLAVSLGFVAVLVVYYGDPPSAALALLPVWVIAVVLLAMGVGLWLSALNVLYRDVRYALGFVIQLWFFASPVIFSSSLVDGNWRYLFAVNPLSGLLDGFRWSLIGTPPPTTAVLVSLAVILLIVGTGFVYFQGVERRFADQI
jgi:lipopolysaccharide transport system permease protein